MKTKKHLLPFAWGFAAAFAVATAFGTGDETPVGPEDNGVVLREEDLAERAEILRNLYRRITPPEIPLVQDIGTWPAAWEEFGANWDAAAVDREYGAWVVPVEVTQDAGATVVKDGNGAVLLWRGWTDFARPESADVVLTGGLVAEEEWAVYEGIREAVARLESAGGTPAPPVRTTPTNGLRFTSHEWTSNGTFRLELAYEIATNVDVFAYAVACTSSLVVATWTNDENQVITDTNTVWTSVGLPFNGMESDWELRGTGTISNGVAEFEDSGFSEELSRLRFYAAAVAEDTDGDGLNDGVEVFVSHSNPQLTDTDGDGIDDLMEYMSSSTPSTSNVWWNMKTTNEWNGYGYRYLGYRQSWPDYPIPLTNLTITGIPPVSNAIPVGITLWGGVDDAVKVDGQPVPGTWTNGISVLSNENVTAFITNLPGRSFQIALCDWPDLPNGGYNEIRLGTDINPFRVEWEWKVPIDIRMEPIWTSENLPLDNPSGVIFGSNAWFHVDVFPEGVVPEENIVWTSLSNKLSFVTTNCGSRVQVRGDALGGDALRVEVEGAEGDFGLPDFHVKVMPLMIVTARVGVVVSTNGDCALPGEVIPGWIEEANSVLLQTGWQIVQTGTVQAIHDEGGYYDVELRSNAVHSLRTKLSQPGGMEIYFVHSIVGRYGETPAGAHHPTGMLISAQHGSGRTVAHETGHACGACDIYASHAGTNLVARGEIREEWMPQDWGAYSTGGMPVPDISDLLQRLLMYGYTITDHAPKGDVPSGFVHGLGTYGEVFGWETNLWGVGLTGFLRAPSHQ